MYVDNFLEKKFFLLPLPNRNIFLLRRKTSREKNCNKLITDKHTYTSYILFLRRGSCVTEEKAGTNISSYTISSFFFIIKTMITISEAKHIVISLMWLSHVCIYMILCIQEYIMGLAPYLHYEDFMSLVSVFLWQCIFCEHRKKWHLGMIRHGWSQLWNA